MSKTEPTMKDLYARYRELADASGIEGKALSGFKNKLALEAAIKFLDEGQDKKAKVPKGKTDSPLPVNGNYVKLTPSQRARLRAIRAKGGTKHQWGDRWQLTQSDLDRLLKKDAATAD